MRGHTHLPALAHPHPPRPYGGSPGDPVPVGSPAGLATTARTASRQATASMPRLGGGGAGCRAEVRADAGGGPGRDVGLQAGTGTKWVSDPMVDRHPGRLNLQHEAGRRPARDPATLPGGPFRRPPVAGRGRGR